MLMQETKNEDFDKYYRVNSPFVVHETFAAQETAIINLKTGNYYSLNVSGAEIWAEIEKSTTFPAIVETLLNRYEGSATTITGAVRQFIINLVNEDLIVVADLTAESKTALNAPPAKTSKTPFVLPLIEGYTDMQELLLLDPIHDVDDQGCPFKKAD